jgi:hypothetical protein
MTEQYKMGWTDPRTMSTAELFADYVATKAQVDKPWVGLTNEEHIQVAMNAGCMSADWLSYGAAVELALKEKNT